MSDAQQKVDALVQRQATHGSALAEAINARLPEIEKSLPRGMVAHTFARIALTTIQKSPLLMQCSVKSLIGGVYDAAQLGLHLDGVLGHAYLVPYKVKGVYQAQLQVGYKGLIELAYRSNVVRSVSAEVVRAGDSFRVVDGTSPLLEYTKALTGDRGDRIAAYSVAHTADGVPVFRVLTVEEIEKHRSHSKAWRYAEDGRKDSPWHEHPDAMWCKTAVRELAKYLPQCPQMQRAASLDEAVDHGRTVIDATPIDDEPESPPDGSE